MKRKIAIRANPILAATVTKKKLRVVGATYDLAIEKSRP
jgi:hypothetical protein